MNPRLRLYGTMMTLVPCAVPATPMNWYDENVQSDVMAVVPSTSRNSRRSSLRYCHSQL